MLKVIKTIFRAILLLITFLLPTALGIIILKKWGIIEY